MTDQRAAALKAVGVYVRTLREQKKLSRKDVCTALPLGTTTLVRLENGENDVHSTTLARLLHFLGGSFEDTAMLQLNGEFSEDSARQVALRRLNPALAVNDDPPTRLPSTALLTLLDGLRLIAKKARKADVQGGLTIDRTIDSRITDEDILRADEAWQTVVVAIRHLKDLGATDAELQFLLMHPDVPTYCAERLAITRLGIGTVEDVLAKYASHTSG
jgi:transcriptional regulator with XRE-family HTH domain